MLVMSALLGVSRLEKLTHRHGVKLSPLVGVSVEECGRAEGKIVGHGSVKSASRMYSINKANQLVEAGVVINGVMTQVSLWPTRLKRWWCQTSLFFLKTSYCCRSSADTDAWCP